MRTLSGTWVMALIGLTIFTACGPASPGGGSTVELKDASGRSVGSITLTQQGQGVQLRGTFNNLPAGEHGIHIHAVGACTPDFAAAGGHFNPTGKQHGQNNPNGPHAGDMPNLTIGADGTGSYEQQNTNVTLGNGQTSLNDADGSAIVIHAKADDYTTDPAGNSGDRIACGVVPAAQAAAAPH